MNIQTYLQTSKLITDGSFGTYYLKKYNTSEMPEKANLDHPERVQEIHESYLESGARLLRTNTFACNTLSMKTNFEEVKKSIHAACELARKAIANQKSSNQASMDSTSTNAIMNSEMEESIFLAGDIGPIPFEPGVLASDVEEEYEAILRVFLEEQVDAITFETFSDMEMILAPLQKVFQEEHPFIMVQFSVNQFGYSESGQSAKRLLREAVKLSFIDAIGLNCGVGPGHMCQIYSEIPKHKDKYYIALPNAGYPKRIRNKVEFENNPKYFAKKVDELAKQGIQILGGCCGTNPVYIAELEKTVDQTIPASLTGTPEPETVAVHPTHNGFIWRTQDKANRQTGGYLDGKIIAVELAPPPNADDEKIMEAAQKMKQMNVDVVTFPDSPSGRTRVDSVLMAMKVKAETGLTVMPHICCRDKNAIAMRSLLLGAHINGIYDLLVMTGDPVPTLARDMTKSVFNFSSVGLMKIIEEMNEDVFPETPISFGGVINQSRRNLNVEINRVKQKMEAGAEFFLTQPTFCKEDADRIAEIKKQTNAKILCGIMPLISRKNALFMSNEIAGVPVTQEVIDLYPEDASREEGESIGVQLAKDMIAYTKDFVDGYYFSFPFNRVYLLSQILGKAD